MICAVSNIVNLIPTVPTASLCNLKEQGYELTDMGKFSFEQEMNYRLNYTYMYSNIYLLNTFKSNKILQLKNLNNIFVAFFFLLFSCFTTKIDSGTQQVSNKFFLFFPGTGTKQSGCLVLRLTPQQHQSPCQDRGCEKDIRPQP